MGVGNNILLKRTYLNLNTNLVEGPFYWDVTQLKL